MITIKHGSIFDSTAAVLVCPVNCVGVMGKGLALEFKRRWPEINEIYKRLCDGYVVHPGDFLTCQNIGLAFTKNHWRNPSQVEWIKRIMENIVTKNEQFPLGSIAIPQLGCGCGGLDWADVWPLYERHLGGLDADVEVWIHESH